MPRRGAGAIRHHPNRGGEQKGYTMTRDEIIDRLDNGVIYGDLIASDRLAVEAAIAILKALPVDENGMVKVEASDDL